MVTEETLYAWVQAGKTGTKELKATLDLFKRTHHIRAGQVLDNKLTSSFLTWVGTRAIAGKLKNALRYGAKLSGRQGRKNLVSKGRGAAAG